MKKRQNLKSGESPLIDITLLPWSLSLLSRGGVSR